MWSASRRPMAGTNESDVVMGSTVRELLAGLPVQANESRRQAWTSACAHALGLGRMAVTVNQELVWCCDATSARLDDQQFILGQGPGLRLSVLAGAGEIPDPSRLPAELRPQFTPEVEELGVAALFVWPVRIGAVAVGTEDVIGQRLGNQPALRALPLGERTDAAPVARQRVPAPTPRASPSPTTPATSSDRNCPHDHV